MVTQEAFLERLAAVRARIDAAARAAGRAGTEITLLPVTKFQPPDAARFAFAAGLAAVGENRVQEAAEKRPLCPPALRWELIGRLQSNKARAAAAGVFDRVQSLDSPELATRLARVRAETSLPPLPVLIQANTDRDPAKSGVAEFDALRRLADAVLALPALRLEGLMTIPALDSSTGGTGGENSRRAFDLLREWRDALAGTTGAPLPVLSMGMSADLEHAVAAGSTLVRVGTALFGGRAV
ncbi:MAG: YggS family pyridoxal phosphate-dependent enzyme [Puniceicoccales bacterium]|jgi:pyridoxal phosphate enzyme (YggS family)|nr:YggS family pyridoxal phosphate-dependent enzyme [Puniceicoccales bacterium]